jgi:hypothetical protein
VLSQWESLLKNLGKWQGSFTRFSAQGDLSEDTPSVVTLEGLSQNQIVRQTVQYLSATSGEVINEKVLEYSSLSRAILFFENGAFSFGSIQFAPVSEFGAEFGLIQGDRRLRLVQLFDRHSQLHQFTLIREHRQSAPIAEKPHLTVEALTGTWIGEAITLYPDLRSPDRSATHLSVWVEGDRLFQKIATPQIEFSSSATIQGSRLLFQDGSYPVQVLLLPDGASANTPLVIPRGKPFLLEAGWLIAPNLRQRIIRSYDAQGGWVSLTLVTEQKEQAT